MPFLTQSLANFLLTLPGHYVNIIPHGISKAILRQAIRRIVPNVILERTDNKMGLSPPERIWLLCIRPYVERVLNSRMAMRIHAFNVKQIQSLWEQMVNGFRQLNFRVWRWVNLILWRQKLQVFHLHCKIFHDYVTVNYV